MATAGAPEACLERIVDGREFRREKRLVPVHMVFQSSKVLQEAHMAKLVQLVGTDRAKRRPRQIPADIAGDPASRATPAPARVTLEVEAKMNGRSEWPASVQAFKMSAMA